MNEPELLFFNGLLWYLETRNWAFQKIITCPTGSQGLDIKMYHYLYFSNLFGAVDLVRDYSKAIGEKVDFDEKIRLGFVNANDYQYARELRNAIVHRGVDPAAAGHSVDNLLFVICPSIVQDRSGRKSYSSTFKYTTELAEDCNRIVDAVIFEFADRHGFLIPDRVAVSKEERLKFITETAVMPDWAKAMATQALETVGVQQMLATIPATRVQHLKDLLGQGRAEPSSSLLPSSSIDIF